MVYLDTGCLVKLYYPEHESAAVAAAVVGDQITFTALHELEIVTAMELKVFRREAKSEQVVAAMALVQEDLAAGKLVELPPDWRSTFREAVHFGTNPLCGNRLSFARYLALCLGKSCKRKDVFILRRAADSLSARHWLACCGCLNAPFPTDNSATPSNDFVVEREQHFRV